MKLNVGEGNEVWLSISVTAIIEALEKNGTGSVGTNI